jgi:MFS family permease
VLGNTVAVILIPFVGNLSDRIGRRIPIMVGALGSGLLSYGYLYAISIHNVPLAIVASIMMWGVVYQGYNAIFPSFYPEMFPARMRVSGCRHRAEHRHHADGADAGRVCHRRAAGIERADDRRAR